MTRYCPLPTLCCGISRIRRQLRAADIVLAAVCFSLAAAFTHPCKTTRDFSKTTTSGIENWRLADSQFPLNIDCRSRGIIRIPTNFESSASVLDLSGNTISTVRSTDFKNVPNLRVMVLSHNAIRTLEHMCFRHLRYLETLDLSDNDITSFSPDAFKGLQSLRELIMSGLPLTSYPIFFAAHTPELRVLSLSAVGDATVPAEYGLLPRLEVLDFYKDTAMLTTITAAILDNIRDSNIKTLSFRKMKHLRQVEAGCFSNLTNMRSLIIASNERLSFRKTVVALASTTNTAIDSVVLDGASGDKITIFAEPDFCSSFWRGVRRLSIRGTSLLGVVFANTHCLSQTRELIVDYNYPMSINQLSLDFPAAFANLKTLSLSHRTLRTDAYLDAYNPSLVHLLNIEDYFPARPPVRLTQPGNDGNTNNQWPMPPSLEFVHMSDIRIAPTFTPNKSYCLGNVRYLNISHNELPKVICDDCRLTGHRLEILDMSHNNFEAITSKHFNFPKLRYLNLSNNALGVSGSDFRQAFRHLTQLEDINLSHNRLTHVSQVAFERCTHLRRLNLANNELMTVDLKLRRLTSLEYIDLSGNHLTCLSRMFTVTLDQRFKMRPFELNIRSNMFVCNDESVSFVRWTRVTHVRLTQITQVTCSYNGDRNVKLREIDLKKIARNFSSPFKAVIAPVIVGFLFVGVIFILLRCQRWYVLHRLVPSQLADNKAYIYVQERLSKEALLYLHTTKARDKQRPVSRLLDWDDNSVTPMCVDKLGLNARISYSDV